MGIINTEKFAHDLSEALSSISSDSFGKSILKLVRHGGMIKNFGTYYIPDLNSTSPIFSVWNGDISDYRYRRFSREILKSKSVQTEIIEAIRSAPEKPEGFERFSPLEGDIRYKFYELAKISERLTITTRKDTSGLLTFFLRSDRDGKVTPEEIRNFNTVLPIAHQLIQLRHWAIGSEVFHFQSDGKVSEMRARALPLFSKLSVREAEACDLIVKGVTIQGSAISMGIKPNSVITLRRRAYKKLGINSMSELSALLLNYKHMRAAPSKKS